MNMHWKTLPRDAASAIVTASVRHPFAVVLLSLALTLAAGWYTVGHVAIDTDTGNMLDPELPHMKASNALDAAFPHLPGDVVVYTESAHAGEAEDAADALGARLAERKDIARALSQPGGGEFFARNGLLYLETDALWDLSDRLTSAEPLLGALANDASLGGLLDALGLGLEGELDDSQRAQLAGMFDKLGVALQAHAEGRAEPVHWRDELFAGLGEGGPHRAFVLIDPAQSDDSFRPTEDAIERLHALLADMRAQYPGVKFFVTGSEAMDGEELVTVADDATLTTSLSFVAVALVLVWGLNAAGLVVAVLLTLACGLAWTSAFAVACVGSLNLISVCFAVLFIGMGVDFGIQYAMRYREELALHSERGAALTEAARGAGGALVLAAVGAAICFFAFVPTSYLGLAQLGVIAGFSMGVALIANLTVLPALLALLPAPRALARRASPAARTRHGALARFVARARTPIMVSALLAVVAGVVLLPRVEFDLNPLNLKDPHSPAVEAWRRLASQADSSPYTADVLADSLDDAVKRAARLRELKEVDKAITLADYLPTDQDEKLEIIDGMRAASGALLATSSQNGAPDVAAEAAAVERLLKRIDAAGPRLGDGALRASATRLKQGLERLRAGEGWPTSSVPAVRALLLGDLPQAIARLRSLLDAGPVSMKDIPADLAQRYLAADGRARVEIYPSENLNDNAAMRRFARAVTALEPQATGAPVELVAGSHAVIQACVEASVLALVLTIIMHVFVLSGVLDAVLVAAPLVLAMLLTVITSVLCDVPLNFANIIALPLLIGLNNAYGAYLVIRRGHADDIHHLLDTSTPRAVLFSGLTAVASFGTLAASKHPGMAGMGVLIALSLGYALLCALVVLPALMAALEGRRQTAP
ncbi:MAG: MMPL family transporter [Proteobacteria bacterium]|nr:MMPL family transporter [Pseudomonadota bacterium]